MGIITPLGRCPRMRRLMASRLILKPGDLLPEFLKGFTLRGSIAFNGLLKTPRKHSFTFSACS